MYMPRTCAVGAVAGFILLTGSALLVSFGKSNFESQVENIRGRFLQEKIAPPTKFLEEKIPPGEHRQLEETSPEGGRKLSKQERRLSNEIRSSFIQAIEQLPSRGEYIDPTEEEQILQHQLKLGVDKDRARVLLFEVCQKRNYVLGSKVRKEMEIQLSTVVDGDEEVNHDVFEHIFLLITNGKIKGNNEDNLKKMIRGDMNKLSPFINMIKKYASDDQYIDPQEEEGIMVYATERGVETDTARALLFEVCQKPNCVLESKVRKETQIQLSTVVDGDGEVDDDVFGNIFLETTNGKIKDNKRANARKLQKLIREDMKKLSPFITMIKQIASDDQYVDTQKEKEIIMEGATQWGVETNTGRALLFEVCQKSNCVLESKVRKETQIQLITVADKDFMVHDEKFKEILQTLMTGKIKNKKSENDLKAMIREEMKKMRLN